MLIPYSYESSAKGLLVSAQTKSSNGFLSGIFRNKNKIAKKKKKKKPYYKTAAMKRRKSQWKKYSMVPR
ncbi:hypothetical protein [Pontibacter silvestris]